MRGKHGRQIQWHVLLLLIPLLLASGLAGPQQQAPAEPPQLEEIGREMCLVCHELKPSFAHTPHAGLECESCHGPGNLHAEAGGGDTLSLALLKSADVNSRCMSCHSKTDEVAGFGGGPHGRGGLSCVTCHISHPDRPGLSLIKADRSTTLCSDCHRPEAADFRKPFHHPVPEKAMECDDCHLSHSRDLGRESQLELGSAHGCVSCHADKKGPFVFEHPPGKLSGCETCHQPHGSQNARMLTRNSVMQLCLECHTMTPGAAPGQPPSFHDIRTARFRNCLVCHGAIHGSNVSSSLQR